MAVLENANTREWWVMKRHWNQMPTVPATEYWYILICIGKLFNRTASIHISLHPGDNYLSVRPYLSSSPLRLLAARRFPTECVRSRGRTTF